MHPKLTIRRAQTGDEHALALVGQATFLGAFAGVLGGTDIVAHCFAAHTPDCYRAWLHDSRCALWLVEHNPDAAPIGYCLAAPAELPLADLSSEDLELKRIYVLSKFQGVGVGRRLLEQVCAHAAQRGARRLLLGVYAKNQDAIAFYQRVGFAPVGTRQFPVGTRVYDDTIMALALPHQHEP